MSEGETRKTLVSVKGLFNYVVQMSNERYAKYPLLEGCKTREEALYRLAELVKSGVKWLQ